MSYWLFMDKNSFFLYLEHFESYRHISKGTLLATLHWNEIEHGKLFHIGGEGPTNKQARSLSILYVCYGVKYTGKCEDNWQYLFKNVTHNVYYQFPFARVHSYAMFIPESMANCKDP